MAAAENRPRMLLLVDENVPNSVAEFFASRGHSVKFVRDLFPGGIPDPVIAAMGDHLSAIVVTWDRDFDALVRRIPDGNKGKFRKLGRITFSCSEPHGRELAERWIRSIEFHYEEALQHADFRMIIQIQENGFKVM
jgi:predicted nuclease of predicted toxin-antitoxin system